MNHTEVKHSLSLARFAGLASLAGLVMLASIAGGCIAPAADADRQADLSHDEGITEESSGETSTETTKSAEEREHGVDVVHESTGAASPADEDNHVVAPARVDGEGATADDSSPATSKSLVAAASSPTDTPQPSPWKGHNPPPIGPGGGPPNSDTP